MNKKNNKKIIILIAIILVVFIMIALVAISRNTNKQQNSDIVRNSISKSEEEIKNIIKKYDGTYIKMQSSTEEGFAYDIYLYFGTDLFEDGKSQEFTYTNLINALVKNEKKNIRLLDTSRDITIRVYYESDSDSYYYTVNGENDFFNNYASSESLKNYKNAEITELQVDSSELNTLIKNNWNVSNDVFGTKESIFEDYDIFFEEGIKVKRISESVFNVVYNGNYNQSVINGIKVGESFKRIEEILGKATFKNDQILGYKSQDFYVFFEEDEISIYRNREYEYDEFEILLRNFIDSELTVKEFINELTYLWNDYTDYTYSSSFVYLNYYQQGVVLNLSADSLNDIVILGNYDNISEIEDLINDKKIYCDLESDGMFIYEQKRFLQKNNVVDYSALPDYVGSSAKYMAFVKNNKVEFKAIDETKDISYRLVETVNSYFWFSDTIFVYSVSNKGIYYFNLDNKEKTIICEGNEQFTFESFENGILMYDGDKSIELESD